MLWTGFKTAIPAVTQPEIMGTLDNMITEITSSDLISNIVVREVQFFK
jgi:hypothetical protein